MLVKIIPKANPSNKGEWVWISFDRSDLIDYPTMSETIDILNQYVPDTHFVCDYES